MYMTNKLGRAGTDNEELPSLTAQSPFTRSLARSREILDFTTKKPMFTKLGKVATYSVKHPPIMPHNSLIPWSCEVT